MIRVHQRLVGSTRVIHTNDNMKQHLFETPAAVAKSVYFHLFTEHYSLCRGFSKSLNQSSLAWVGSLAAEEKALVELWFKKSFHQGLPANAGKYLSSSSF